MPRSPIVINVLPNKFEFHKLQVPWPFVPKPLVSCDTHTLHNSVKSSATLARVRRAFRSSFSICLFKLFGFIPVEFPYSTSTRETHRFSRREGIWRKIFRITCYVNFLPPIHVTPVCLETNRNESSCRLCAWCKNVSVYQSRLYRVDAVCVLGWWCGFWKKNLVAQR